MLTFSTPFSRIAPASRATSAEHSHFPRTAESDVMKKLILLAIAAASLLSFPRTPFAASPNTYQVTGPILEVNDTFIAVQKGKERWEIARDAKLKANAELKVGDKVTITYTMKATKAEVKSAGAPEGTAKTDAKVSSTPARSPANK